MNPLKRTKRFLKMSPPRKFSGKVKPGMGIDGTEGESFTRRGTDPWTVQPRGVDYVPGDGVKRRDTVKSAGQRYTDNESGLRNKMPDEDPMQGTEGRATGRDIWSDVEGQSSDSGNRAVKSRGND
jgi:hypothetical protein